MTTKEDDLRLRIAYMSYIWRVIKLYLQYQLQCSLLLIICVCKARLIQQQQTVANLGWDVVMVQMSWSSDGLSSRDKSRLISASFFKHLSFVLVSGWNVLCTSITTLQQGNSECSMTTIQKPVSASMMSSWSPNRNYLRSISESIR